MILLIALLLSLISSVFVAYTLNVQRITKYLGWRIDSSIYRNIQNAITPKAQNRRNLSLVFVLLAPTILAFFHAWWASVAVFLVTILLTGVNQILLGRSAEKYVNSIGQDLYKRKADYLKENDKMRASVADEYSGVIAEVLAEIKNKNLTIRDLVATIED